MHYRIDKQSAFSLASITEQSSDIVIAHLTADLHESHTVLVAALEHMYADALLSGAGSYDRAGFLAAVNLLGSSIGVSLSDGSVTVTIKSRKENFKKTLALAELMLSKPTFPSKEMLRIKTTTCNELHTSKEDTRQVAHDQLVNHLYGKQDRRYTYDQDSTAKTVKAVTVKDLRAYHKHHLETFWHASIYGNKQSVTELKTTLNRLKRGHGETDRNVTHQPQNRAAKLMLKNIPSRQNIDFSLGAPLPFSYSHPDYMPFVFGLAVLAKWGGFTGRLMSTVREKEGLTYGIYGKTESFTGAEHGYWRIMTFFAPDKAKQALTSTLREIKKIHDRGITKAEYEKFRVILKTAQDLVKDSPAGLLRELHGYHCQNFGLKEMEAHKRALLEVKKADVNRVLREHLNPSTISFSGAGPVSAVKKELQQFMGSVS